MVRRGVKMIFSPTQLAFEKFDADGDGLLDASELHKLALAANVPLTLAQILGKNDGTGVAAALIAGRKNTYLTRISRIFRLCKCC